MAKKNKRAKQARGGGTLIAALLAGGVGAIVGLAFLGRRGAGSIVDAVDGALETGSTAADLRAERHNGPGDRAPTDFRPDPTASVNPRKRDGMTPATLPNPMATEPVI